MASVYKMSEKMTALQGVTNHTGEKRIDALYLKLYSQRDESHIDHYDYYY